MTSSPVVRIEKLAFGGSGVGRIDGKVCFVPFTCPGDEVRVVVTAERRSYLTARIGELVTPSPFRTVPPCPLFARCGGCTWQQIAYPRQLDAKREILAETLWRGARVPAERVGETVAAPLAYGWRNRVQFKLHYAGERLHIGFYRSGSHFVEDAPGGCPVALPAVNGALARLRELLAAFPEPDRIPQINIGCGDEGVVATVNYIGRTPDAAARFFRERFPDLFPLTGLCLQTGRSSTLELVCGDPHLAYALPDAVPEGPLRTLTFRPGGFSQVNGAQNRALLRLVCDMAGLRPTDRLLDLYCGNGNFSLPLAGSVASVTGLEGYEDSIAAAIHNCDLNGITNAEYRCCDARDGVSRLAKEGRRFDVAILDPPRAGAAELIADLCRLKPERIVYISCDPSTLARDCGILAGQGYRVARTVPVDMFPQTYHLESVTLLHKEDVT